MKKRVFGRYLSMAQGSRRALFRGLIRALVTYGKIKTTKAKAKAVQGQIDKLVTLAKKKDIPFRRKVYGYLGGDRKAADALFGPIAEAFRERQSGFTRIVNLGARRGDAAEMVRLEWVEEISKDDTGIKGIKDDKSPEKLKEKKVSGKGKREPAKSVKK